MRDITLEELLAAGCHFGHQVNRRNPKADDFIYEARSNINIINLEKTREGLLSASEYLKNLSQNNGYIVFVGTKRQARQIVKDEVERIRQAGAKGVFFVTYRWVGGTLTNFPEVSKNFKKLRELNEFLASGQTSDYTKREVLLKERERDKLRNLYEGIENLDRIPDALVVVGTQLETTAVKEAIANKITLVGIVDTNADPTIIDYPVPANDDAVGSIKLITSYLTDSWLEGQSLAKNAKEEELAKDDDLAKNAKKTDKKTKETTAKNAKPKAASKK